MQRYDQHRSQFFPLVRAVVLSVENIDPFHGAVQGNGLDFSPTYTGRLWLSPHQNVRSLHK